MVEMKLLHVAAVRNYSNNKVRLPRTYSDRTCGSLKPRVKCVKKYFSGDVSGI